MAYELETSVCVARNKLNTPDTQNTGNIDAKLFEANMLEKKKLLDGSLAFMFWLSNLKKPIKFMPVPISRSIPQPYLGK